LNTNALGFFRSTRLMAIAGLSLSLLSPAVGHAALLTGNLNFSSGATNVNISLDNINFGAASGPFTITPSTGTFSTLNGSMGTIQNIDNPPYVVGVPVAPASASILTFAAAPNITIEILELLPGSFSTAGCAATPPAGGQTCTPPNSPYNLTNQTASSSSAVFSVSGLELDSLTNTSTMITGLFTAQFPSMTFQDILTAVNGGGTISTSYSASFTTTVPEPATGLSLALGTFAIAGFLRFRRSRNAA
jgi:hypothetical protein